MVTGCCLNYDYYISRGQSNSETDELGQEETHPNNKMKSRWRAQDSWNEWIKGEEEYSRWKVEQCDCTKERRRRDRWRGRDWMTITKEMLMAVCLRRRLMFCNGPLWFRLSVLSDERLYLAVVFYKHCPSLCHLTCHEDGAKTEI